MAAGIERAWPQGLWVPVLGINNISGRGRVRLILDWEYAWYTVERVRTTSEYVEGVVVETFRERVRATRARECALGILCKTKYLTLY